jgi:hypothetical protein
VGNLKVLVISEGPHELGHKHDVFLDDGELPALPILVRRLVEARVAMSFTCRPLKTVGKARVNDIVKTTVEARAAGLARKVLQGLTEAKIDGFDAVVVLIDRDGDPDSKRLVPLQRGRDSHWARIPVCAVGTAVETFDAWMIADPGAIEKAGGDKSKHRPDPEKLNGKEGTDKHPKDWAAKIFGGGKGLGEAYATVAAHVDIEHLRKSCPKGFAPFADDVRARILPAVNPSS